MRAQGSALHVSHMTREIEQLKAQLQHTTQGYHTVVTNMFVSPRCPLLLPPRPSHRVLRCSLYKTAVAEIGPCFLARLRFR